MIIIKVSGIVCEYNPFHNGHKYHIDETIKNGATHIVAVMSGNFVQRGDVAVMNKIERAKLAVKSGVDLVIEIPSPYCLAPAEIYASGAVYLLNALGVVDEISFGSESGNIDELISVLDTVDNCISEDFETIQKFMEKGYTYPKALSQTIAKINPKAEELLSMPNNTLAFEYIRAVRKFKSGMSLFTVKRQSVSHDSDVTENEFASASYIRKNMGENREVLKKFTNSAWNDAVSYAFQNGEIADIKRLERVILYKLRMTTLDEIKSIYDIPYGLDSRIYNARMSDSLDELLLKVKSKNYTMARIRRALLNILIDVTKEDMKHLPPYVRVLASNKRGMEILSCAKGKSLVECGTSLTKLSGKDDVSKRFAELEAKASDIYGLATDKIQSSQKDYHTKFVIDFD